MIHPNMATMLGFITTDLNISKELLNKALKSVIPDTFNMISVDRDTSTNDTVLLLANGLAGNDEIVKEDEDILIILKLNKQVEELINYRKITFNLIWWDASGLKIPNQAIVQENDLNYVIRNRAGYLSKILVKVKKQGEKYSIVEAYKTEELKELGFTEKEINSYRKISLYDEILINPNLDKTKELN